MNPSKVILVNPTIDAFARQILTIGGTYLVTKGYIDAGTAIEIVGAIIVLLSVGWSVTHKVKNPTA